jgi:hypothetical protein
MIVVVWRVSPNKIGAYEVCPFGSRFGLYIYGDPVASFVTKEVADRFARDVTEKRGYPILEISILLKQYVRMLEGRHDEFAGLVEKDISRLLRVMTEGQLATYHHWINYKDRR